MGGRHAGHLRGHQVRPRAGLRDRRHQRRPVLVLPVPAGQVRREGNPTYQGPYKDKTGGLDLDPDPGRDDHRLQPDQPRRRLRLPDGAAGLGPGAAGRTGHRRQVHASTRCPTARSSSPSYTPEQVGRRSATRTGSRPPTRSARRWSTRSTCRSTATPTRPTSRCRPAPPTSTPTAVCRRLPVPQIAASPNLKKQADDPVTGYTRYFACTQTVRR